MNRGNKKVGTGVLSTSGARKSCCRDAATRAPTSCKDVHESHAGGCGAIPMALWFGCGVSDSINA